MLSQMTFDLIPNATSSPVSASGVTRFALRAGTIAVLCGLVVAHASLSARQAKRLGSMTSGTYGQRGSISSSMQREVTYQSLESRLRAVTDSLGSTLFKLTWKERTTPSGRSISALRASARPISVNDFTSWPTPTANPTNNLSPEDFLRRKRRRPGGAITELPIVAQLASWPTPRGEDSESCGAHRGKPDSLTSATALASWVTPSARDWKDSAGMATKATNSNGSERQRLDMLPRQA
jgi:hypothetical protein